MPPLTFPRAACPRLASRLRVIASLAAFTAATTSLAAATWIGTGPDNKLSTSANWQDGVPPASDPANTSLYFSHQSGGSATASNDLGPLSLYHLAFNNAPEAPALTLTGHTLRLGSGGLFSDRPGTQTIATSLTLLATQTWHLQDSDLAVTGDISESPAGLALTKQGNGTLTLSGNNTFTGGLTLAAGTVTLEHAGALGSAGTLLFTGGTLRFSPANTADYSTRFSSAAGQSFRIDTNGQNVTFASALASTGGALIKFGLGSLTLTGNNTYTGNTVLSAGSLILGSAAALPANSTLQFAGGALGFTAATGDIQSRLPTGNNIPYAFDTNGLTVALSSNFTGTATSLRKTGAGTLTLTGTNTYTGPTTLEAGILSLASATALSPATTLHFNGGTLQFTANNTADPSARFSTADFQAYALDTNSQNIVLASALSSFGGTLRKTGAGNLTLTADNSDLRATTVSAGTLTVSGAGTLGSSTGNLIIADTGTLDLATRTFSTRNITLTGGTLRNGTLSAWSIAAARGEIAANVTTFNLTKTTTDTVTLSGTVTTTAIPETTISAGTLLVSATGLLQAGNLTIAGPSADAATLHISGGQVTTNTTPVVGNVTAHGTLVLTDGGRLEIDSTQRTLALSYSSQGTLKLGTGGVPGTLLADRVDGWAGSIVEFNHTGNYTFSPRLTGDINLLKLGPGTTTLTGNNTATGHITIQSGTLVGSTTSLSTHIVNHATLVFDQPTDATFSPGVSGSGTIVKDGVGALTLTYFGDQPFTGNITVNAGTLVHNSPVIFATAPIHVAAGAAVDSGFYTLDLARLSGPGTARGAFTYDSSSNYTLDTRLEGRTLLKQGTGTLALAAANTYGVRTVLQAGRLVPLHPDSLGSSTIELTGGILEFSATNTTDYSGRFGNSSNYAIDTAGQDVTFASPLNTPESQLNKYGAGTLTLLAANDYLTATTVHAGTLRIVSIAALGGSPFTTATVAAGATLDAGALAFPLYRIAGPGTLTTTGSFTHVYLDQTVATRLAGSGSLLLDANSTLTLTGDNTFTGGVTLELGTLVLGSPTALGFSGPIDFAGGTLKFSATGTTDYSARFSSAPNQNLRLDTNAQSITFASPLASPGGTLTKLGAGTLTLAGANTYSGNTTVSAGTLELVSGGRIQKDTTPTILQISGTAGAPATFRLAGGDLTATQSYVGYLAGGVGLAEISSGTWQTAENLIVGNQGGTGTLTLAGGTLTANSSYISSSSGSTGTATVSGGAWNNAALFSIGNANSTGTLTLNGGQITSVASQIGNSSNGTAHVSGGSWQIATQLGIGSRGTGILNLTGSGLVTIGSGGSGSLLLAGAAPGSATLNLGTGGVAGTLSVPYIQGGPGTATVNFNHTGTVLFTPLLFGTLSVNKSGPGTTILRGNSNFTGHTTVHAGTLALNGNLSTTTVTVNSGAILAGAGILSGAATFAPGSTLAPQALAFTGGLTLNGGTSLDLRLGPVDPFANSRVVVPGGLLTGPSSGTILLNVFDSGGFTGGTFSFLTATGATLNNLTSSSFTLGSTIPGFTYDVTQSGNVFNLTATAIPEPSTYASLAALVTLALTLTRRRR